MKRKASTVLLVMLLASMLYSGFKIASAETLSSAGTSTTTNGESVPYKSFPSNGIVARHDIVIAQPNHKTTVQAPMESHVASMLPAAPKGSIINPTAPPPAIYDEQLGLTFTQNFTSLAINVTATQQIDSYGYGPGYLLNGLTDKGYWYQVGLSFDWPYTNGGYDAGFHLNYEAFNSNGKSVFPPAGGGLQNFNRSVNNSDKVLLNLHFSSGLAIMYGYDWNTHASATENYTAVGASIFQGQTMTFANSNGFFTGLMTEWWHANAYYSGESAVVYNYTASALSSGWFWADEWVPSTRTILFSASQYASFSNPTQLQSFTTNGASEAANAYLLITGAVLVHDIAVTNIIPSKTIVGLSSNADINVTVANMGNYTETLRVTVFVNATSIASQNATLSAGNSTNLVFAWNTIGFAYGNYTLSADASPVPGETNTTNNNLTKGNIFMTIPGDVNGDRTVNVLDLLVIANALFTHPGDQKWNPNADLNNDNVISVLDLIICANHLFQNWS